MSKRWLKDFLRYIHKVFLPEGRTKWAKDKRRDPEIEPGTIWATLLIGFALQVQSLEELERRARKSFKKLLPGGQRPPPVMAALPKPHSSTTICAAKTTT
ncbi:hypothetical protein Tph_c10420 [Thermacetogenium phaeum DSM 12270]|uniref:Transposase n=1 Tax=Thermacetogenium phaeum (strain ATCC BAA-254 / DSM 26808 / PB) TaxID=1089553 RepID=K4LH20_THEPS|nr:hypothetical protein Tph_c10420 [Thermacetogenium phaeum DSM 12270]